MGTIQGQALVITPSTVKIQNALWLLPIFTAIACTPVSSKNLIPIPAISEQWEVLSIHDGDTLKARQENRTQSFRFCGIDAPELSMPLGKESRDKLRSLVLSSKNKVMISEVESDRYGRVVAEIFTTSPTGEKFLNEEMVSSGMAMVYSVYVNKCPNKIALGNAEEIAKNKRSGVWGNSSTVPPWEFRKRQRQNNGN
jgi:micrococcal nuclease